MVNMNCLVLSPGFFLQTIETLIFAYLASLSLATSQGLFPRLENVGAFKNVSVVPTQAVCGLQGPSAFCHSSVTAENLQLCIRRLCNQDCPYRSSSPSHSALLAGLGSGNTADHSDLHPFSQDNSTSFVFGRYKNCSSSLPSPNLAAEFTLAVWLKPEREGVRCVIEKTVDGQILFRVTISEKETMFYYHTVNGLQPPIKVMTLGRILVKKWIHLSVQVHQTEISFFINGLEENNTAFDTRTLRDSVTDFASSTIKIGQSLNGFEQFVGKMQDFRIYNVALTNREILEISSGDLHHLHIPPHCHCPGSHPGLHPLDQRFCVPSGAQDWLSRQVSRLNPEAQPLSFNGDVDTSWISQVFTNASLLNRGVIVSIDLENGQYQVFEIVIQFSSPQPRAIKIQRKKEDSSDWEYRQYFARNCSIFGMENNGDLENPDSVKRLQFPECQCHGHARNCDRTSHPSRCLCSQESFTEGHQCDHCLPLYNDKAFRGGDPIHAFNCKPCQCHGHANSCHYNSSLDPFPLEHHRGGGGVCEDCQHHTTGRNCELCERYFFRQVGANPLDIDVCKPCNCNRAGTRNGSLLCDPVGGQCNCKRHVSGRQCLWCQDGFYNLQGLHPDGCLPCNCNTPGMVDGDITCHPNSGQCQSKANVIGLKCNHCRFGFKFLQSFNDDGCEPCQCNQICSPLSRQCECKKEAKGRFYVSPGHAAGCLSCSCCAVGAVNHVCNSLPGQCTCYHPSAAGQHCDRGQDHYFGFDPQAGSCQPCNCHVGGSLNGTCDLVTGQCFCKQFVMGFKCDTCVTGASHLDVNNLLGCSKTPSQQPPPRAQVQGSSAISLSWSPPDSPKANCLTYTLFRNGSESYTTEDQHPYNVQYFLDSDLAPYTSYTYDIMTTSVHGSARSAPVIYKTKPGIPEGHLNSTHDIPVSSHSVTLTWSELSSRSGPIEKYVLSWIPLDSTVPCVPFEGQDTSATIWNPVPFTQYCFSVQACTGGGCLHSLPITVTTAQAPPRRLSPPVVWKISSTELHLAWSPPVEPNGKIIRYELYMKRLNSTEESPVFESSGWLSPHPSSGSANESALPPPQTTASITSLEPYTEYQFRLLTVNMAGSVSSTWISERTGESAPVFMFRPSVSPLSSHSLNASWEKPAENVTRGKVVGYNINVISEQSPQQDIPVMFSKLLHSAKSEELSHIVEDLKPCRMYTFTVSLCNAVGCVTSASTAGQTLAAGIKASFRTRLPEGLMVFASLGNQEEYFALQLKNGRLSFLSDPQGSPVEIPTTDDHGKQYSDGLRHEMVAVIHEAFSQITLDGQYTGSSASLNHSMMTGSSMTLFVGELPRSYSVLRKELEIIQRGFVDCLRDVHFMKNHDSFVKWIPLDWQSSEDQVNMYNSWEGYPTSLKERAQFLGAGFLELMSDTFHGGKHFEISLKFRTDQLNGLLLFICHKDGPDFLAMELKTGLLSFRLNSSLIFTQVDLWLGLAYCDGKWNQVIIKKEGTRVSASVNGLPEQVSDTGAQPLVVNSPVYLGGIPQDLRNSYRHSALEPGFGGCMKEVTFTQGAVVNLASVSSRAVRVNLDGCLSSDSTVNCRGNDSILVYRGSERSVYESGLQPFTEYLYRVIASHDGGSVHSEWSRGRTTGAAPQSAPTPSRVCSLNGYSVEVTWDEPTMVQGVVEKYILKAYGEEDSDKEDGPTPRLPSASAELAKISTFTGVLTGSLPFHSYVLTLTACSLAGYTESSHALNISTPQEAPEEVQPPVVRVLPNSLLLSWDPPRRANGIITQYSLYMDGRLIYTGGTHNYTATDLELSMPHQFILGACTHVGCTNSSRTIPHTAGLLPEQVDAPILTVLDSRTIHVQWKQSRKLNGILEHYVLYVSSHTKDSTEWSAVYNSTEEPLDYLLGNLFPGNKYLVKLGVWTDGGCTLSELREAVVEETVPEGVPAPRACSSSPSSFNVSWTEPEYLNGVITSYGLYLDGTLIHNSSEVRCHTYGFAPGSSHTFQVEACTARGCALGPLVENWTLEAPPEGTVNVLVRTEGSRGACMKWEPPLHPNGRLTYSFAFTGNFYAKQGKNYTLLSGTKTIPSRDKHRLWTLLNGLLPFTNHMVHVRASNSQGSLVSDPVLIEMPPGAPDGLLPPRLASATPTSLQVVWSTPARNNAPGSPRYQLQMRPGHYTHGFLELFPSPSAVLSCEVKDLQPFTVYEFRVVATNFFGSVHSTWALLETAEDKPGPVDARMLVVVEGRVMSVTWQCPSKCNGVITHYNIYQDGQLYFGTSGNVTNCTAIHLQPHTAYQFQGEACTVKGCSLSPESQTVWTFWGVPEILASPELSSDAPTSVIISWQTPIDPKGLVENFTIERQIKGKEQILSLVTVPGSHTKKCVNKDPALSPRMQYEYRVLVSTLDGCTSNSTWVDITRRLSRPAEVQPPMVYVLGPDSVKVTWKPSLIQNGGILSYKICMPDPHLTVTNMSATVFSHIIPHLIPFTDYSVTIAAGSGGNGNQGGCTESPATSTTTHPALPQEVGPLSVIPLSEAYVRISWQPPPKPTGPNLRYELLRRTIQQPLASNPPEDLNLWHNIYSGTWWFYEDKGLGRFTTYEYKLFVYNSVGFIASQEVTMTTLAGFPDRGANITASILNHTAIIVRWAKPTFQALQGVQVYCTLFWNSATSNISLKILPEVDCHIIVHLTRNIEYQVFLSVFNGVYRINSTSMSVTTHDSEPQGMLSPEVVVINSTAVQVIWTSPSNPSSIYSVYVNHKLYKTGRDVPGSWTVSCLSLFSLHNFQVEVCTEDPCVKSSRTQITMVEDASSDIPVPRIHDITSRSLRVDWVPPGNPKRMILGYELLWKTWLPCPKTQKLVEDHGGAEFYKTVKCQHTENICGHTCYSSETKVCCAGFLHDNQPGHSCCGEKYIPFLLNSSRVCCGGRMQEAKPDHQCCFGFYVRIRPGMFCCGQDYVNMSDTICCSASSGESKAHLKKDDLVPVKCCETELIPESQQCCNEVGYNPLKYVCSDKISTRMMMKETRVCATLCPGSMEASAHCSLRDFNATSHVCAVIREPHNVTGKVSMEGLCSSVEKTVHSGGVNELSFRDGNLKSNTMYECRVSVWNNYWRGFSQTVIANTKEDVPRGVRPPSWTELGQREDAIFLNWKKPMQPNGPIVYYILLRDGIGSFRGSSLNFTDTEGIQAFQEYSYQLKAYTLAGCASSTEVVADTTRGVPESVPPPCIIAQSTETLQLSWSVPEKPNGIIKEYQLRLNGNGFIYSDTSDRRQHTVTGLQPYTKYSFTLSACMSGRCTSSEPVLGQTLQAAPQEVWVTPRHIIINSTTVELYWNPPEKPNGLVSQYQLSRNGSLLFMGGSDERNFTDKNLEPNSRYIYKLEVKTGGGSGTSDSHIVQMPMWTPEDIRPPCNLTVLGQHSIFLAWPPPGVLIPKVLVEYNILLSGGSVTLLTFSVGHRQSAFLKNLAPFTQYDIRIQACKNGSCGVSSRISVSTPKAAPMGLRSPLLKTLGSSCIAVKWMPPRRPNGVITRYFIHRRPAGAEEGSLVFEWSQGALEFTDSADTPRPFTQYEYRVSAQNAKGSVDSLWSSAQTQEAPPRKLQAPGAQAISAHSVLLNWRDPASPNGLITRYRVIYQEAAEEPTPSSSAVRSFTVKGTINQAHLLGLEPFTTYHVGVVAANSVGEVSSPWTQIQTLESSPNGLSNFMTEQKDRGCVLLLQWSEPVRTKGVIKTYNIFSDGILEYTGLTRQFLFQRLAPSTLYTLTLEACTVAGCAHSEPQPVWTDEAPPDSQLAPTIQSVETTSVELCWSEPFNSNGKIIHYDVICRCFEGEDWGIGTAQEDENIVFTEYNTERNTYVFNDIGLQPRRQCAYRVCTWNSAGYTCSSWSAVRTLQAPPEGLAPPEISYVSMSRLQLLISWVLPQHPNGLIQSYGLQRNGTFYPYIFAAVTFNYTDGDVLPFSTYSTGGGHSASKLNNITTPEAAPAELRPAALQPISASQINASRSPPSIQNGKITKYLLRCEAQKYPAGQGPSLLVSRLQPYTQYNFTLVACTEGGCTASASTSAWTMEAPPENMGSPELQVTGSQSIEITWKPPRNPNGQIRSYELRRDGDIIYTGLKTYYHDFTLTPHVEYGYTVTAINSQGSVLSPLVKGQTSPSAPSGLEPPQLHASDAQEIVVEWDSPAKTSGDSVNYTLFIRELFEREIKTIHINMTHGISGSQSFTVKHLKPFHRYEVRVQAWTILGCTVSDWTSTRTLEMPPLMQPAPQLKVQTAAGGFHPMVALWWAGPQQPSGKVLYFELYRRQIAGQPEKSSTVLTYNGSLNSFMDLELLPFTEYEYQVWAVNSAGKVQSNWTWCRTGPTPPEGLRAPTFHSVSSTQAVVNIGTPARPNGNVSEGTATQQTLHDLEPFTTYTIGVEACTCFNCCSRRSTAQLRTHPAPPSGLSQPQVQTLGSRTASFQWTPPLFPNGVIQSYQLQLRVACPPDSALPCLPSHTERRYRGLGHRASLVGLQPYTVYKVRVVAHNEAGSVASRWTSFSTQKDTFVFQVTCTTDVGSVKTPFMHYDAATGRGLVLTTPGETKGVRSKGTELYSELWFIVLMAVLGLILLAIFLSLILQRKIHREPYTRERPPLVPLQQRLSPLSVYPPGETQAGLTDTRILRSGTPVSIRSSRSLSVLRIPSQSQISQTYTQGSLHRSVSQLMDVQDKKVLIDDSIWETIMGHNSGLYVDEEDLMNAIKGFSSVAKEQTTFTDTQL